MLASTTKKGITSSMKKTINFSSVPENIALAERMVDEICANYEINDDHYGNILISLTEAVNNAIQHGNKNDPKKNVEIVFDVEASLESFSFTVKDEGDGFDYTTIPDPTAPENIEKISGRGVFLMRNLADKVGFNSDGREIQLNFKISPN